jgi:hypothetical protein
VFSDAPSYIIVIEGNFRARRRRPPDHPYAEDEQWVSYPFQTLVIDMDSGRITDSGSSHHRPDLASLGDIVTDRRACRSSTAQPPEPGRDNEQRDGRRPTA